MKITLRELKDAIKSVLSEQDFAPRPDQSMYDKDVKGHQVRVRPAVTKPGAPQSWQTFASRDEAEDFIKNSWAPGDYIVVGKSHLDNGTLTVTDKKTTWWRPNGR